MSLERRLLDPFVESLLHATAFAMVHLDENQLEQLVLELYSVGAVQVRDVVLKTGRLSPIYIDLRVTVSHPSLLKKVADALWSTYRANVGDNSSPDVICGVPYTALPIATVISLDTGIPMVVRRKEAKSYGTKKLIEGVFKPGDKVLLIEDILTSGTSILETANALMLNGLDVIGSVVLLDRDQGGLNNLKSEKIACQSVITLPSLISILLANGKIDQETASKIDSWLQDNKSTFTSFSINERRLLTRKDKKLSLQERLKLAKEKQPQGVSVKLLQVMIEKKSNLCVSIDLDICDEVLKIVSQVGPYVCAIKLHADILSDFSFKSFIEPLEQLASEHKFLIIEDRKFADIGNTVRLQYTKGLHKIGEWADLVTAHAISGPGVVTGLQSAINNLKTKRGIILIAEMSSHDNLLTKSNVEAVYNYSQKFADVICGFVCQRQVTIDPTLIHFTPGVSISSQSDCLGQRYVTPEMAISNGTDVIIVGRGITSSQDVSSTAKQYQQQAFQAYQQQCTL